MSTEDKYEYKRIEDNYEYRGLEDIIKGLEDITINNIERSLLDHSQAPGERPTRQARDIFGKEMPDKLTWEGGVPLTFDMLPTLTQTERYKVYKIMKRLRGSQGSQGSQGITHLRYDRVMRVYEERGFEGMSLEDIYGRVIEMFDEPDDDQTYLNYQKAVNDMREDGILPFDLVQG